MSNLEELRREDRRTAEAEDTVSSCDLGRDPNRWLTYGHPKPQSTMRLFCFPHAGGGASKFHQWNAMAPGNLEVLPIQLPGHESRIDEPPITDLPTLIDLIIEVLQPMFAEKP